MYQPEPHTQLTPDIGTDSAIIMGDPARVDTIAKLFDDGKPWAYNREYKSFLGTYRGKRILANWASYRPKFVKVVPVKEA